MNEKLKKISNCISKLEHLERCLEGLFQNLNSTAKSVNDLSTAFVVSCNDTPVKVIIGDSEKAKQELSDLKKNGGDSVDMGIFHLSEVPWE